MDLIRLLLNHRWDLMLFHHIFKKVKYGLLDIKANKDILAWKGPISEQIKSAEFVAMLMKASEMAGLDLDDIDTVYVEPNSVYFVWSGGEDGYVLISTDSQVYCFSKDNGRNTLRTQINEIDDFNRLYEIFVTGGARWEAKEENWKILGHVFQKMTGLECLPPYVYMSLSPSHTDQLDLKRLNQVDLCEKCLIQQLVHYVKDVIWPAMECIRDKEYLERLVWQLCEETKWTVDETLAWIEQTEPARAQHYRR